MHFVRVMHMGPRYWFGDGLDRTRGGAHWVTSALHAAVLAMTSQALRAVVSLRRNFVVALGAARRLMPAYLCCAPGAPMPRLRTGPSIRHRSRPCACAPGSCPPWVD